MGLHQMLHMPKTNIKKGWWGGIRTGKDHSPVTITGKTEQLWCTPGTQTGSTHHRSIIALVIKRNFAPQIKNLMCRKRKKNSTCFFLVFVCNGIMTICFPEAVKKFSVHVFLLQRMSICYLSCYHGIGLYYLLLLQTDWFLIIENRS